MWLRGFLTRRVRNLAVDGFWDGAEQVLFSDVGISWVFGPAVLGEKVLRVCLIWSRAMFFFLWPGAHGLCRKLFRSRILFNVPRCSSSGSP